VFAQAGRGLLAAHQAGIVHRDFKPSNVYIGSDGRVRVLDFGLARQKPRDSSPDFTGSDPPIGKSQKSAPSETATGARLGTPAYMSPEHLRGMGADERSDQFSFCVSLYQALFHAHPFEGDTPDEIVEAIEQGRLRVPVKSSQVPDWLRALVLRGLSGNPSERYPSLAALLERLTKPVRKTWQAVALGSAALAVLVFYGWGSLRAQKRINECRTVHRPAQSAWEKTGRDAARAAFYKTGVPFAADAWKNTERALAAYAESISVMQGESCNATLRRHEQSEELLNLRQRCLAQRMSEWTELGRIFEKADAKMVERAVDTTFSLSQVADCGNLAIVASPTQPATSSISSARLRELEARLAEVRAVVHAGQYATARDLVTSLADAAQKAQLRTLFVEIQYEKALLDMQERRDGDAVKTMYEVAWAAEAIHHDYLAARAWIYLVFLVGHRQSHYEQAHLLERQAHAAIERLGGSRALEAELDMQVGATYAAENKNPQALEAIERGLIGVEAQYGQEHPMTARCINNRALVLLSLGHYDDAIRELQRALTIMQRTLGAEHPQLASAWSNVSGSLLSIGRYAEAREAAEHALSLYEKALGPQNLALLGTLVNLSESYMHSGHVHDAVQFRRRALAIAEAAGSADSVQLAEILQFLGEALEADGEVTEAQAADERSLAMFERLLGPEHSRLAFVLGNLALVELDLGQSRKAVDFGERAAKLAQSSDGDPDQLSQILFTLARAVAQSGRDPARALSLATKAHEGYLKAGPRYQDEVERTQQWISTHRERPRSLISSSRRRKSLLASGG
jgi:tetratricopeptide (TPR) repeat protein